MKLFICLFIALVTFSCKEDKPKVSVEHISSIGKQDSLFRSLMAVTDYGVPEPFLNDSLAFLILPVQKSCPSCRKKTIDSLLKHCEALRVRHYVIISASAGFKTMNMYFVERDSMLPIIPGKVFLDSINLAYRHDLYRDNPSMYYTYNRRAYKRVLTLPATVKSDLREFFSGQR